ncbi:Alpha/Beta hydrolase protein [Dunaliella salina]|uniref:Alpha/Beta hydrolase protein n=1 Tax=Dunaliella salina TaxID=3046 RepID=A0ABQ7FUK4_DUNSA|nr:Alpha/Beta hydrolase protein [Dunaliella salina]|eukprot:KAF5826087.1 Alpha/Beta hydrolase protein [Dunaliella salina]
MALKGAFKEMHLVNPRKLSLYTVQYLPTDRPATANLIWAHGYGEHVGRYQKVFSKIAQAGIAVHSFDAEGHGKSDPGDKKSRAVVWKFKNLVDDMYFVSERLLKESHTEQLPTFLGGQSMGGLIQAYAVLQNQAKWAGLILQSAAIDVEWTPILR